MVLNETSGSFQAGVSLESIDQSAVKGQLKHGSKLTLAARFHDFLGGPTRDTGKIILKASHGSIYLPNGQKVGQVIELEPGEAAISDTGELALVYIPDNTIGKVTIEISCQLGNAKMEVDVAPPPGYAVSEMLESIIYAFLVAIIIRIFFFQTFWIPSASMEPTLYEKDRIVANKLIYRIREPHRGEVVIFRVFQPGRVDNGIFKPAGSGKLTMEEAEGEVERRRDNPYALGGDLAPETHVVRPQDYIKRVVGLQGEVVQIDDGVIYIDGSPIEESFETRIPNYTHFGPVTVPQGEIFVLGDNRSNSQDSHVIGTIPLRNVEGRAEVVFWPPNRMGIIPQGHGG